MSEELLTILEARQRIKCGHTNLCKLINSGQLKAVKIGRSTRIPIASIDAFIASLAPYKPESVGVYSNKMGLITMKKVDALQIRNAAIEIIEARGELKKWAGRGPFLQWSGEDMSMLFRTPAHEKPHINHNVRLHAILLGMDVPEVLPYGLDIWDDAKGKVFNIEWNDKGTVRLTSFRRGPWEEKIKNFKQSLMPKLNALTGER